MPLFFTRRAAFLFSFRTRIGRLLSRANEVAPRDIRGDRNAEIKANAERIAAPFVHSAELAYEGMNKAEAKIAAARKIEVLRKSYSIIFIDDVDAIVIAFA